MQEDLTDFVQKSFVEEASRSGNFYATTSGNAPLSLELDLDSIKVTGLHSNKGFFFFAGFFYAYEVEESGSAGEAHSSFTYRIKKGNEVVFGGKVKSSATFEPLVNQYAKVKEFRKAYTNSLVETLSLTFKKNIEKIIQQVNVALDETASNVKN